ncbi:MAG: hypothetical protein RLY93_09185 [Sumerlaeia bacterium]
MRRPVSERHLEGQTEPWENPVYARSFRRSRSFAVVVLLLGILAFATFKLLLFPHFLLSLGLIPVCLVSIEALFRLRVRQEFQGFWNAAMLRDLLLTSLSAEDILSGILAPCERARRMAQLLIGFAFAYAFLSLIHPFAWIVIFLVLVILQMKEITSVPSIRLSQAESLLLRPALSLAVLRPLRWPLMALFWFIDYTFNFAAEVGCFVIALIAIMVAAALRDPAFASVAVKWLLVGGGALALLVLGRRFMPSLRDRVYDAIEPDMGRCESARELLLAVIEEDQAEGEKLSA